MVNFCWFTDEKIFTVAAPSNSQNDRLYAPVALRKKDVAADRLLRTRPTFSKSVMVSVGVSALGRTNLHFVDPSVKVNGQYIETYCLGEIFCQILSSTPITSHFSRMGPGASGSRNCRTPESRDARLFSTKFVATQQPRSEPSRQQDLGRTARTGLQDKH